MLRTSVAAANSALQRARSTTQDHLPSHRSDWAAQGPSRNERELLARFIDAATDIRVTMPPAPMCFDGLDRVRVLIEPGLGPEHADFRGSRWTCYESKTAR
jgi:RNA polymerase sigma-70 factor (ECF subfamily)